MVDSSWFRPSDYQFLVDIDSQHGSINLDAAVNSSQHNNQRLSPNDDHNWTPKPETLQEQQQQQLSMSLPSSPLLNITSLILDSFMSNMSSASITTTTTSSYSTYSTYSWDGDTSMNGSTPSAVSLLRYDGKPWEECDDGSPIFNCTVAQYLEYVRGPQTMPLTTVIPVSVSIYKWGVGAEWKWDGEGHAFNSHYIYHDYV